MLHKDMLSLRFSRFRRRPTVDFSYGDKKSLQDAGSRRARCKDKLGEMPMRILLLSALFALGVGLAGTGGASAAAGGSAINNAAKSTSLLTQAACRKVTVCRRVNGRRVCVVERVCR